MKSNITKPVAFFLMLFLVGLQLNAATYYSKGSLDATLLASWSNTTDGTGDSPTGFISTGDVFVIQTGHEMTTSGAWTVGVAAGGGKLQISNGGKLNGTALITIASGNTFQIDNGGTYVHNVESNLGVLFGGTEVFADNSNFIVMKIAASPVIAEGGYGNLTFRNNETANKSMNSGIQNVKGNLTFETTVNPSTVRFALVGNQTTTINVGGDLIVNSSDGTGYIVAINVNTGNVTINVAGSVKVLNGTFNLKAATPALSVINVGKNIEVSGGTFTSVNTVTPSIINFTGVNSEFIQTGGTMQNPQNINLGVNTDAILTLKNSYSVGNGRSLTVNGTLNIESGDTLKIGGTTVGTGVIDASVGTISYNGTAAQTISNIKDNTINNLVVNNAAGASLSTALSVTGNLNSITGTITLGDNNLTITNTGSVTNTEGKIIQNGIGVFTNNGTTTLINKLHNNILSINTFEGGIEIGGLMEGSAVSLYSIDGKMIDNKRFTQDKTQFIVKRGVYILNVATSQNSYCTKVVVK
jgi:hypothetical protein